MVTKVPPPPVGKTADLEQIVLFTRVVQTGSFTAAARGLGLPKSTASRKLAELEARVGARLLQRTTRSVSLTDVGRVYYEHCVRIVAEVEEAELAVAQLSSTPRGLLRVTVPLTFAFLGPLFATYLERHPEVQLELVCTDRKVDVVEERFDLALRAGVTPDSSLVARRLGVVRRRLVAAPRLAKRLRKLSGVDDLVEHPCVAFAPEGTTWALQGGVGGARRDVSVRPRLITNDYEMLCSVVRAGLGVALVPGYLVADDLRTGLLEPVLPDWSGPDVPIVALYPTSRHLSPKVVALIELLRARIGPLIET